MTFTEWINTQEDICSKLREQGYEEKNDIRKFFNDRIRCIYQYNKEKNRYQSERMIDLS